MVTPTKGTTEFGPELPSALTDYAFVKVNSTLAVVLGGSRPGNAISGTLVLDIPALQWSVGPTMMSARKFLAGGVITDSNDSGQKYLFAAGGL